MRETVNDLLSAAQSWRQKVCSVTSVLASLYTHFFTCIHFLMSLNDDDDDTCTQIPPKYIVELPSPETEVRMRCVRMRDTNRVRKQNGPTLPKYVSPVTGILRAKHTQIARTLCFLVSASRIDGERLMLETRFASSAKRTELSLALSLFRGPSDDDDDDDTTTDSFTILFVASRSQARVSSCISRGNRSPHIQSISRERADPLEITHDT